MLLTGAMNEYRDMIGILAIAFIIVILSNLIHKVLTSSGTKKWARVTWLNKDEIVQPALRAFSHKKSGNYWAEMTYKLRFDFPDGTHIEQEYSCIDPYQSNDATIHEPDLRAYPTTGLTKVYVSGKYVEYPTGGKPATKVIFYGVMLLVIGYAIYINFFG